MSICILKPGICASFRGLGRSGFADLGINPSGAMDELALQWSNILAGNERNQAALECFFPAPEILFETNALLVIGGADFSPCINGQPIPIHTPFIVHAGSVLTFKKVLSGNCCYLSVSGGFLLENWLNSETTASLVAKGGFQGRNVRKGDKIQLLTQRRFEKQTTLPWRINPATFYVPTNTIRVFKSLEWKWTEEIGQQLIFQQEFTIGLHSNRMATTLIGGPVLRKKSCEMLSSAVVKGTVQLLPNGNLLVLMADHQTTGGYPRVLQIASVDLPILAQKRPNETIRFEEIDYRQAEELLCNLEQKLNNLAQISQQKINAFFRENH